MYHRVIELDSTNLSKLREEILNITKYGYNDTIDYGEALNLFILNEGAWEAASMSGDLANFESSELEDLSNIYSLIHFRNLQHAQRNPPSYDIYYPERVVPYLKENEVVLQDHINNMKYELQSIKNYFEKRKK